MRLRLFAFGKLRTPGLREAADHYTRLLSAWADLSEHELKAAPVPDKSPAARREVQKREGELLLKALDRECGPRAKIFLLDERGKPMTSRDWADNLRKQEDSSVPEVAFCIGGGLGFSDEVRARASGAWSLGPQTLAHELARVVLLEQLYRASTLLRGHPYHNEGA